MAASLSSYYCGGYSVCDGAANERTNLAGSAMVIDAIALAPLNNRGDARTTSGFRAGVFGQVLVHD